MNYPIVIYPCDEGGYVAEVPALKAGLFHSLRSGFCQGYQPEILVSRLSKNYCFKQEI